MHVNRIHMGNNLIKRICVIKSMMQIMYDKSIAYFNLGIVMRKFSGIQKEVAVFAEDRR